SPALSAAPAAALVCSPLIASTSSENHETPRPSTGREASSRGPTRLRHRSAAHSSSRYRATPGPVRRPLTGGTDAEAIAGLAAKARLSGDPLRAVRPARRSCGPAPGPGRHGGRHWTRTSDLLHVKQVL